ncbi:alpha/beta hydrolase-fold protein [Paludibacter sp.]|uniref:alpha/beta hydrolase n=1 Tax=Paludibacter sp. TaxID=1898105 RepID=UPI0013558C5B|nr:alpha/beta hydrolase-fold protein [Paludibacter sp.]MTK53204.1 alpha/beta hydrolase [Paludibacter sp.]
MKKLTLLCLAGMLFSAVASAQVPALSDLKTEPVTVTTGYSLKFHSNILNEDRTVMIALPEGYEKSTKKYPVLYMLDAQWNFNHTAQNLGWLSNSDIKSIPQTIVVGLATGGDRREHDLTPTPGNGHKGGGADSLYRFIKEELMPFVEKNYRTYNYRILGGVSYGGLFVMNAFVKDPLYFNAYLSLSPSMWWENNIMLDKTKELLTKSPEFPTRLYLTMANEGLSMGVDSLDALLKKYAPKNFAWKFDKHPDEVHNTIHFKGIWDGMKFLLADWHYPFIDFGTKEKPFSVPNTTGSASGTPKAVKLPATVIAGCTGVYLDSFGRLLSLTKADNTLQLSNEQLPPLSLYPEASGKFFLPINTALEELHLKNALIRFDFTKNDSLIVTTNGKIEFTAKKLTHLPLVALSDKVLQEFVGAYTSSVPNNNFRIEKKEHSLLLFVDTTPFTLYPMSANKLFVFVKGTGLDLEFLKDASTNTTKINVAKDGKVMMEAKKTN